MKTWFARLNQRERFLVFAVVALAFIFGNLVIWGFIVGFEHSFNEAVKRQEATRREQTIYLRDADLWAKRDAWLKQHQPSFQGPADASSLLDQLKRVAGKNDILLENPAIGTGESNGAYQSVFASIETKSAWPPLVHFLYDVQTPESFLVFENVDLRVDSSDSTLMRGKFKIARWEAPANK